MKTSKKEKPITKKEAKREAAEIIADLAYSDAEAAEKFSDLTQYRSRYNIDRVEEEFYKLIDQLRGIKDNVKKRKTNN